MSQHDDTHDAELEEIVAYLDGELSGDASARVERRLASDEDFRQELQSVERAWHALDELPMATVDDRFSRTTMSMVIDAAAEEVQARTLALPVTRRKRWLSTALAATAAAALGFLAFRLAWHDPNALLLADLPVVDNVDIYSQFPDVAFLRRLRLELGDGLESLSGDAQDVDAREQHFTVVTAAETGEPWLRGLNGDERSTVRAKYNRFHELPPAEQQRMRDLHREIMAAKDSESLVRTMFAYQQWLGGLPPVKQFELRDIDDVDSRVAQIKVWAEQMRDDEALTLTNGELLAFFTSMREPIFELRARFMRSNRGDERDKLKDIASGEMAGKWRRELFEQFEDMDGRSGRFYRAVMRSLPERSRDRFASLAPREKAIRFITWVRQHTACCGEVTHEELADFFAKELNPEVRAQLLSLPPGEMEQALERMYRCEPKAQPVGSWPWPQLTGVPPREPRGGENLDRDRNGGDRDRDNGDRDNGDSHNGERDGRGRGDRRGDDVRGGDGRDRDGRDGDGRGDRRGEFGGPPRPDGFRPPPDMRRPGFPRNFGPGGPGPFDGPPLGPPPPFRGDEQPPRD